MEKANKCISEAVKNGCWIKTKEARKGVMEAAAYSRFENGKNR